jgi:DNA-binding Xre family transcriptional regulator
MEIKTEYYEEMLDEFTRYRPDLASEIRDCKPKHLHAIRITLMNGRQFDYNGRTKTYREVRRNYVAESNDITDEDCREIFAANLAELMRMKGFGQPELSERTGLSTASISKYLRKKATPTITTLEKIANALNCNRDELLD